MPRETIRKQRLYSSHEWKLSGVLFASYVFVFAATAYFIPSTTFVTPAAAVALSVLFFGGVRLWPVVLVAAFLSHLRLGSNELPALYLALVECLQAVLGAAILRQTRIDPLFRRYRDTFILILSVLAVSLVTPAAVALLDAALGMPLTLFEFGRAYAATLFTLLIVTPFILRWFAKPRFNRRLKEIVEITVVFAVLLAIDYVLFVAGQSSLFGLPLMYLLLVPLFWIALRLRPRFVTLALLLTAIVAVGGTYGLAPLDQAAQLVSIETFLITVASIFFIIVSLEEDRRLNTNLMRSQLSTLENAITRISTESLAKNDFIAVLAHELRNPLAPVVSAIDYLKLTGDRNEDELETLDMMENRMKTVRRLLDDLLDVSKISEGKLTIKKERLDLEQIIRRAILSTAHYVRERHQELIVKTPKEPLIVLGDPVRLEQIFSNLLTNASKYSDPGDQITVKMERIENTAEVSVSDQGVGIPPDALERIFEPFHQIGSGVRTQKGLGIGLALVKSFVSIHRGTITATSEGPGTGSQFTVHLPLAEEGEPSTTPLPAESLPQAVRRDDRVLIVDFNDATAWSTGRLLELQKFDVEYAYDTDTALDLALSEPFGTVLVALDLPNQDGYTLAKTLRSRRFSGRLIGMARTRQHSARGHLEAGLDDVIMKPAEFADLKRVMPEVL